MKTKKGLLGILLGLVMVLGLMPGMSLTAYADGHTHNFEYSASGDTITATCKNDGCDLNEGKVTLTIKAPENLYYDDRTVLHLATLENLDAFNAATGKNFTQDSITYYKGSNQSNQIKNGKQVGATYTAKIAADGNLFGNKVASVTFKFIAKPVEHTHSFTYTANGNVITATCTSTTGTCDLTNKQATLTLNAPLHATYEDGKDINATLTGEIPGVTNPTIHCSKGDATLGSAPTDAGTYTAWCQLGNATARVEYTINKKTNPGFTTLPQAKGNLVYTGSAQELITAGATSTGDIRYGLGTADSDANANYTGAVPSAVNAGDYYVWCKIDGGKNYTSTAAQKIAVSIAKANITPSVSIVGWTYGETAKNPMVSDTANPGNGEVTYTYKVKDAADSTYSATVPTDAGDYTVKAAIAETTNYKGGEATADFTIAQASPTITVPTPAAVTYDPAKTLESVTLPDGWAWVTKTTVPTVTNNGYAAEYTVPDYTNYDYTNVDGYDAQTHKVTRTVSLTVNKAEVTAPTIASKTYNKQAQTADVATSTLYTVTTNAGGTNVGDYDVVLTLTDTANYKWTDSEEAAKTLTFTITQADAVAATVTANNRTYDGTEKPLVTVTGEATGGTMQYALGTATEATEPYTTSIPQKTNAGT